MKNNMTERGNCLRDAVFSLVKAAQKDNCNIEKSLSGKNVDVYFEDRGSLRGIARYAVECKNYDHALQRNDYSGIMSDYIPVKSEFDYLIIITNKHPTPGVLASIIGTEWVEHFSFDQFSAWLMDFSHYLRDLKAAFLDEGLSSYYMPIQDKDGNDVETLIDNWVSSESCQPQALLGGYGMGKTCFSKFLANKYASQILAGKVSRIPIYLKLGDIFNEQGLEGLICKTFASRYNVRGFAYSLFLEMNRQGQFVIILDGFDEMKHAMSFRSFKSNITEFRQLVVATSKVIILGRPNVFTSEDERASMLHGIEKIGDREIQSAEIPNFKEIEIGVFTKEQLEIFVPKFLDYQLQQQSTRPNSYVTKEFCSRRKKEILDKRFYELISRPVHARMLIYISLSTEDPLASFSRYALYSTFIDKFLAREGDKAARAAISIEARSRFIEKVAWSQWIKSGYSGFSFESLSKIDLDIDLDNRPKEDVIRELVIGSPIEPKGDDYFYFAHRSFQEYLVTEFLINSKITPQQVTEISKTINSEIILFIEESGKKEEFSKNFISVLSSVNGAVSLSLLQFASRSCSLDVLSSLKNDIGLLNCYEALVLTLAGSGTNKENVSFNLNSFNSLDNIYVKLAFLLGLVISSLKDNEFSIKRAELLSELIHSEVIYIIGDLEFKKNKLAQQSVAVNTLSKYDWIMLLLSTISPIINDKNEIKSLIININIMIMTINKLAEGYFSLLELPDTHIASIEIPFLSAEVTDRLLAQSNSEERKKLRIKLMSFWRCKPTIKMFVPVERKSDIGLMKNKLSTLKLNKAM